MTKDTKKKECCGPNHPSGRIDLAVDGPIHCHCPCHKHPNKAFFDKPPERDSLEWHPAHSEADDILDSFALKGKITRKEAEAYERGRGQRENITTMREKAYADGYADGAQIHQNSYAAGIADTIQKAVEVVENKAVDELCIGCKGTRDFKTEVLAALRSLNQ